MVKSDSLTVPSLTEEEIINARLHQSHPAVSSHRARPAASQRYFGRTSAGCAPRSVGRLLLFSLGQRREGGAAQLFQAVKDRGLSPGRCFRITAEAELMAAGVEQGLDLEGELGGVARYQLPLLDAG